MLPKNERLKERYLFNIIFKKRRVIRSKLISLYYLTRKKDTSKNLLPKTAFIVGTKVDKRAVGRNLIKRRMRSSYKTFQRLITQESKDYTNEVSVLVWVANPQAKDATFLQVKEQMESLMGRLEREAFSNGKKIYSN